jgi:hypothetical protein
MDRTESTPAFLTTQPNPVYHISRFKETLTLKKIYCYAVTLSQMFSFRLLSREVKVAVFSTSTTIDPVETSKDPSILQKESLTEKGVLVLDVISKVVGEREGAGFEKHLKFPPC